MLGLVLDVPPIQPVIAPRIAQPHRAVRDRRLGESAIGVPIFIAAVASAIGHHGNALIVKLQFQRILMRMAGDDRAAFRFAASNIRRAELEEQRIGAVVPAGAKARIPGERIERGQMLGLAALQTHIQVRQVERAGFLGQAPVVRALGDHAGTPQKFRIRKQATSVL